MKNLKNKIFWLLIIILTLFILFILFIFNYSSYKDSLKKTERNFNIMNDKFVPKGPNQNMMFMDATIYTVSLNNNEIVNIISHSTNGGIDKIKNIASEGWRRK